MSEGVFYSRPWSTLVPSPHSRRMPTCVGGGGGLGRGGLAMILSDLHLVSLFDPHPVPLGQLWRPVSFPAVTGEACLATPKGESGHRIGSGGDLLT